MTSQALEQRAAGQVPDLVRTPALTITAEDVALPRLYVAQYMSSAVQEQLVKAGSIFAALSGDDPDPVVLYDPAKKDAAGVVFYVIGLRKGKSFSDKEETNGELLLWDYDDPNADARAWVTYNYTLYVPELDDELPCKFLLTRTGKQTALKINTVLKKQSIAGPAWINAFKLTTAPRENTKGKFFVAQVAQIEADPAQVEKAGALAVQISAAPASDFGSPAEEPAI